MERATDLEDLEYLEWLFQNADFGPADSDVRDYMQERFMDESGKNLPSGYNFASDGETVIDK